MQKYLQLFRVTIEQYFVYRLNFFLWRFRVVLNLILIYFLWSAIYLDTQNFLGYSRNMMLTYILLASFLSDFVFSSKIHEIGAEILQGDIINKILKPIPFMSLVITREIADKSVNILFALLEISILILILRPGLAAPHDAFAVVVAFLMLGLGLVVSFFISFSVAMMAFWTAEIWAPRFIYFILVFMLAGNFFPLDILPIAVYKGLLLTPFPYFIFLPIQIYLKGVTLAVVPQIVIGLVWVGITWYIARYLWNRGMRVYSFYGR